MPRCYECCKYYSSGVCHKYKKEVWTSRNPLHYGLLMHPFFHLTIYYDWSKKDVSNLITLAEKHLSNDISKNICKYYQNKGYISYKQRKLLLHQFFNCYEEKERHYGDIVFCQVE